jgi:hypothetical protein
MFGRALPAYIIFFSVRGFVFWSALFSLPSYTARYPDYVRYDSEIVYIPTVAAQVTCLHLPSSVAFLAFF